MNPYWLLFIVPVSFCLGFFISSIMVTGGRADLENEISFWRHQYFILKNRERREML